MNSYFEQPQGQMVFFALFFGSVIAWHKFRGREPEVIKPLMASIAFSLLLVLASFALSGLSSGRIPSLPSALVAILLFYPLTALALGFFALWAAVASVSGRPAIWLAVISTFCAILELALR